MTPRIIQSLSVVAAAAAVGSTAHATTIYSTDFTSSTYTAGALNGQDGWASGGGTAVVPGTGVTFNGFEDSVNNASSAASVVAFGETYTTTLSLAPYTYVDTDDVGSGPAFGVGISNTPSNAAAEPHELNVVLRRTDSTFRLSFSTNWGGGSPSIGFNQSGTVDDDDLGILFLSDQTSDPLDLRFSITRGVDNDDWTLTGELINAATATSLLTYTQEDVTFDAAVGSNLYGAWVGGQGDANQNIDINSRTATAFTFESTVVIPEPASFVLCGVGALALMRRRR